MLCGGATSPANIRTKTGLRCDGKCSFSYDYDAAHVELLENRADYLRISLGNNEPYSVKFNSESYKPTEIRIYQPGIHTYNVSERADAEIIVVHAQSASSKPLYVCTPLTARAGTNKLDSIIRLAKDLANSKGGIAKVNNETTIDLSTLVHNTKFFTYMGTNFNCEGDARYIVYALPTTSAYSTKSRDLLGKILTCCNPPMKTDNKVKVAVNVNGPMGSTGGEGNVYIKCRPTGEGEGTISVPVSETDIYGLDQLNEYGWVFTAFIGAVVMLALWHGFARLMRGVFGPASMRPAPGDPPSA